MAKTKIKLDSLGIQKLLNSSEVRDELQSVGSGIAASAGPEYVTEQWYERKISVVNVKDPTPGALAREARTGNLARAVGRQA